MQAASYHNVSQSSPIVDQFSTSSASAGGDPASQALTTVDGGVTLGLLGINQGTGINPDADATLANMTELLEVVSANSHHLIGQVATDGSDFTPSITTTHLSRAHLMGVSLRPD